MYNLLLISLFNEYHTQSGLLVYIQYFLTFHLNLLGVCI